jgi:hypothetical protein
MLPQNVLDVSQPVVDQPQFLISQSGKYATTTIVTANDDVAYAKDLDGELDGREAVQVSMDYQIGDVSVHEHVAGLRADDLVGGNATVRASDPEVLWSLLGAQPGKEVGILLNHLGSPRTVVLKQMAK